VHKEHGQGCPGAADDVIERVRHSCERCYDSSRLRPGALFFSKMAHSHTSIAKSLTRYVFGLDKADQ
jgi:hypothetical protein